MSQWSSLLESPCEVTLLRVGLALSEKWGSHCRSDECGICLALCNHSGKLASLGAASLERDPPATDGPSDGAARQHVADRALGRHPELSHPATTSEFLPHRNCEIIHV